MLSKKVVGCCLLGTMMCVSTIMAPAQAMAYVPEQGNQQEVIETIKKQDPDAMIFKTKDDADKFFEELQNINAYDVTVEEKDRASDTRATETIKDYDVAVTHNLVSAIHLCYSYTVKNGGRFFGSQVGEPFVTMSGYHPGEDYEQKSARVTKEDSQHLNARFVVYFKYYIVAEPIEVNSVTYEYKIAHDIAVGPEITSIKEV